MRPAVHNGPSALLEREPGGEQRAEHVGVGVDVTEHQRTTRSATELALEEHGDLLLDELIHAIEPLALHQRISIDVSMTCPSTCSSMKSMAFDTTSLACRAS